MRIGLVGAGRIGAFPAATRKGLEWVEQVLVADADLARAQAVAKELDCETVPDLGALLRAGLDGLAICTPASSHVELIGRAQDAGLTTFCEKPLASDLASTLRAARRVADGSDAVRFVKGHEVVSVFAVGQNRGASFFAESGDIDAAAAVLTMGDGTIALISGSRYNARGYDVRLEALGSKDSVCVGMDDRLPLRSVEDRVDFPSAMPYTDFMERFHQGYVDELVAFTDLVAGRTETPCSADDALQAFRVAEACDLSRRQCRAVQMEEVGC